MLLHKFIEYGTLEFRKDINGLRSIAVIAVVLFHYNASWMPGGFAGVDVFFVISGFLMTGIIFRGIEQGNFSILRFYVARANRIVPALAVLAIFCFVVGYIVLSPVSYLELNKHAIGSLTFISNIIYWQESGYFDTASETKWLLHTWSLSAEWQFYILYPIVLVFLKRFMALNQIKAIIVIGIFFIFFLSVYATMRWPNPSYYLLPTRAWEMLFGGLAYIYPITIKKQQKKYVEGIGLLLIFSSYALFSKDNLWPGYLALIPVIGSYLIIISNSNDNIITNNFIFQSIGRYSYSIYLWHWTIMVLLKLFDVNFYFEIIGIGLSFIFGCVSYHFIESSKNTTVKYILILLFCLLTSSIFFTNGASFRVDEQFRYTTKEIANFEYGGAGYKPDEFYKLGRSKEVVDYIFIGDSYGQQYSGGLANSHKSFLAYFDHGCFISKNITRYFNGIEDSKCSSSFETIKSKANEYPEASIIIASSWLYKDNHGYKNSVEFSSKMSDEIWADKVIQELKTIIEEYGSGRNYYFVGRPQTDPSRAYDCLSKQGFLFSEECKNHIVRRKIYINDRLNDFSQKEDNIYYFNINNFLCDKDKSCLVSDGRYPVYNDASHISVFGAKLVSQYFESNIN